MGRVSASTFCQLLPSSPASGFPFCLQMASLCAESLFGSEFWTGSLPPLCQLERLFPWALWCLVAVGWLPRALAAECVAVRDLLPAFPFSHSTCTHSQLTRSCCTQEELKTIAPRVLGSCPSSLQRLKRGGETSQLPANSPVFGRGVRCSSVWAWPLPRRVVLCSSYPRGCSGT